MCLRGCGLCLWQGAVLIPGPVRKTRHNSTCCVTVCLAEMSSLLNEPDIDPLVVCRLILEMFRYVCFHTKNMIKGYKTRLLSDVPAHVSRNQGYGRGHRYRSRRELPPGSLMPAWPWPGCIIPRTGQSLGQNQQHFSLGDPLVLLFSGVTAFDPQPVRFSLFQNCLNHL